MHSSIQLVGPIDGGTCPYLPNRQFIADAGVMPPITGEQYRQLMDANCRRSGSVIYRPRCSNCTGCRQWRVDVAAFTPRRDQRRCLTRNADLRVTVEPPAKSTPSVAACFTAYQAAVHQDSVTDEDWHRYLMAR